MTDAGSQTRNYTKPPIIEAVLGVQFATALTVRELERLRERLKRRFPSQEVQNNVQVSISQNGVASSSLDLLGYVMRDEAAENFVVAHKDNFSSGKAAPYKNWEEMFSTASDNWNILRKISGTRILKRIGVRFINRFDFPTQLYNNEPLSKLLNLTLPHPGGTLDRSSSFIGMVSYVQEETGATIVLNYSILNPDILLGFKSIIVDIDVSLIDNVSFGGKDFEYGFTRLRTTKNEVFERLLTDQSRELIR